MFTKPKQNKRTEERPRGLQNRALMRLIWEETNLPKETVRTLIPAFIKAMSDILANGDEVVLPNFASFQFRLRKGRWNSFGGTFIPDRVYVKLVASPAFAKRLRRLDPTAVQARGTKAGQRRLQSLIRHQQKLVASATSASVAQPEAPDKTALNGT